MKTFSDRLLTFAGGEQFTGPYLKFRDYWNHYLALNVQDKKVDYQQLHKDGSTYTFDEKEKSMNNALKGEILRMANITNFDSFPVEQWVTNPMLAWATFAVINQMVDMILPDSLVDSIGLYTDIRVGDWGDSFSFEVKPRDLFVVSQTGRALRQGEVHKQFDGQVTLSPIMRQLTVQVSLYKVLAGKESLAEFVAKVIRSIESEMTRDAYVTFNTAMTNLTTTGDAKLKYAGYSQPDLISLAQKVSAWNGGNKAVVIGTPVALLSVLPQDANYRYDLINSEYIKIGYVPNMAGFDIMAIPQVADYATPFKLLLDDTRLYVVSPSANKILKLALEGSTMSNVDSTFQNANLTQNATVSKSWASGVATNAIN